jgi:hypothetical protein
LVDRRNEEIAAEANIVRIRLFSMPGLAGRHMPQEARAGGCEAMKLGSSSVLRCPSSTDEGGVHVPSPNPTWGTKQKERSDMDEVNEFFGRD